MHDLDLTKTHFEHRHGDITVFGTWFGRERQPALVLIRTDRIGSEGAIPCVIPMRLAWLWSESAGDGAHCACSSIIFAENLGQNTANVRDVMRITSIIREHIGDLLTIPPTPEHRVIVADAIRIDRESGKQHHAEIFDHE